ncbi:response regulator [Georgfuchsia toluolica]|nr:response regulator [Georgfuchsia toluolica]
MLTEPFFRRNIMSALHKVLVVDDDPVVGKSFDRVLSQKGYVVITAQNAQEALAQLQGEEYDLVYTDIKMPGMDGLELAEQIQAKRPWIPVVIVTGYGTSANEARAKAAGVSAFMHKPLSPEMIEGSALNALQKPAQIILPQEEANPVEKTQPEPTKKENRLKNLALFIVAPFVALAYAMSLPFVGIAMLAWFGGKALRKIPVARKLLDAVKNVTLFIAAPFIGLAYVIAMPFVGIGMLAWFGVRALMKKAPAA